MTKAELVNKLSERVDADKEVIENFINAFTKTVKNELRVGNSIFLRGFGTFKLKVRKQKTGRNIGTKTSVVIPEHSIPYFKPAPDFKTIVSQSHKLKKEEHA